MWTQSFILSEDDLLVDTDKLMINMYVTDMGLPTAKQHAAAGFRITHPEQIRVLQDIFPQVAVHSGSALIGTSIDQVGTAERLSIEQFRQHAHDTVIRLYARLHADNRPQLASYIAMTDATILRVLDHPAVEFWLQRLYQRDALTCDHCCQVATYAMLIGFQMGLPADAIEALGIAGILHDLGKMFVEEDILKKPAVLTELEFGKVKSHSHWGYTLLSRDTRLQEGVVTAVLQHHERIDGLGYPLGLVGSEIHLYAKIVAVADAFDAITCKRPYNTVRNPIDAYGIIKCNANTQFDSEVVATFGAVLGHL